MGTWCSHFVFSYFLVYLISDWYNITLITKTHLMIPNQFFYTNVQYYKGKIYSRGYRFSGELISEKVSYEPTIFIQSAEEESDGWRSIYGAHVKPVKMDSIKSMSEYVEGISNICGFTSPRDQKYAFINDVIPNEVQYKKELIRKMILDIETETEGGYGDAWTNPYQQINAITIYEETVGYVTWGLGKYTRELPEDWEYRGFISEEEMLFDFLKFVQRERPDVFSGWYIDGFDIPYIINRIEYLGHKEWIKMLSPWGLYPEMNTDKHDISRFTIPGVAILDYRRLYKKFCMSPRDAYSLDNISFIELKERKIDYTEFTNLHGLSKQDWNLFIDYNKHDVSLVKRLNDKLKYFDLCFICAYLGKVNYEDVFGTVKFWDVKIYNELYLKKIAVPSMPKKSESSEIPGGYVKEPEIGWYKNIASFDLDSLYPNILVAFNMSPETLIDNKPEFDDYIDSIVNGTFDNTTILAHDVTMTANGQYFSREKQGLIPSIVEDIYTKRKDFKKKMLELDKKFQKDTTDTKLKDEISRYDATQYALKIMLNSLYGALAQSSFRYFDNRIAGGVTMTGQAVIRSCESSTNKYLNSLLKTDSDYVIAMDTDSIFLTLESLIKKYVKKDYPMEKIIDIMDSISNDKILPMMSESFKNLSSYLNVYKSRLTIKRECLADQGIWCKKKKYVMNVYDNEGVRYAQPYLKIKGLEIVRSSTPEICREAMKKGVNIIFDKSKSESDIHRHIEEFKQSFFDKPINDISFPRGINDMAKWIDKNGRLIKGTPINVRGVCNYNKMIDKLKLSGNYEKIKEGEKIKFIYLKNPNPVHSHVISFPVFLPKEFEIDEYIDYESQFEKSFLSPMGSILEAVGWNTEMKVNLMDLF